MATSKKGGAQEGEVNCVGDNAIWRQQINFELRTAAHWEENWGFMKGGNYKTVSIVIFYQGNVICGDIEIVGCYRASFNWSPPPILTTITCLFFI